MKKSELIKFIFETVQETLLEYENKSKKPASDFFRRSKHHPEEQAKLRAAKARKKSLSTLDRLTKKTSPAAAIQHQDPMVALLVPILTNIESVPMVQVPTIDPRTRKQIFAPAEEQHRVASATSEKILHGTPVLKKDVVALAKFLMASNVLPRVSLASILQGLNLLFQQNAKGHI